MKIELVGCESFGKLGISVPKKYIKFFPKHFRIIIETTKIKKREKGERLNR